MQFTRGQRIRTPDDSEFREIAGAIPSPDGSWTLFVNGPAGLEEVELTASNAAAVDVLDTDGMADSATVLAGLWAEWMQDQRSRRPSRPTLYGQGPVRPAWMHSAPHRILIEGRRDLMSPREAP